MDYSRYIEKYSLCFTKSRGLNDEWHIRKLPHRSRKGLIQSVTFRLADSIPQVRLREIEEELKFIPRTRQEIMKWKKYEYWLSRGYGACSLGKKAMAEKFYETLIYYDDDKYELIAWSIMPNHIHALIKTTDTISKIVQVWKSYTGKWAMKNNLEHDLGIEPEARSFWMPEYWDRFIRDEKHFINAIRYILNNPKAANLPKDHVAYRFTGIKKIE